MKSCSNGRHLFYDRLRIYIGPHRAVLRNIWHIVAPSCVAPMCERLNTVLEPFSTISLPKENDHSENKLALLLRYIHVASSK